MIVSHKDVVVGVWLIDSAQAVKLHRDLERFCVIVLVSKSGLWYAEKIYGDKITQEDRDDISYRLNRDFELFLDLDTQLDEGYWGACKKALVNGSLGEPDYGYNPLSISIQDTQSDCVCDTFTLLNTGCPSIRGLKCPSKK